MCSNVPERQGMVLAIPIFLKVQGHSVLGSTKDILGDDWKTSWLVDWTYSGCLCTNCWARDRSMASERAGLPIFFFPLKILFFFYFFKHSITLFNLQREQFNMWTFLSSVVDQNIFNRLHHYLPIPSMLCLCIPPPNVLPQASLLHAHYLRQLHTFPVSAHPLVSFSHRVWTLGI